MLFFIVAGSICLLSFYTSKLYRLPYRSADPPEITSALYLAGIFGFMAGFITVGLAGVFFNSISAACLVLLREVGFLDRVG
jgi:hypothetical protein